MTKPSLPKALDNSLAIELFKRAGNAAIVGIGGVGIMVYPHIGKTPLPDILVWASFMIMVFVVRIIFARYAVKACGSDQPIDRFVNVEASFCALIGFGWGRALYVFNSMAMDQPFYLRLMIFAAIMAFILSSATVFIRVFLAYVLSLVFTVSTFILAHDYIQPQDALLTCIALYTTMIIAVAVGTNRRIRSGVADHLDVLRLTEELNRGLVAERALRDTMTELARTDELTNVFNRRAILDSLEVEMARCNRIESELAVMMIDIDHFKRINDTFGHASGDLVIRTVVETLQKGLRNTDVLGRLGGEEFLSIVPVSEKDVAVVVAERLRESLERTGVSLLGRLTQVTISVGIAFYRKNDDSEGLLARADEAMYAAKNKGRNRVELEAVTDQ
jgi:diguanylate cyclase (GGDEF)-like protein